VYDLAERDPQSAVDVAIDPALTVEDAVPPHVSPGGGDPQFAEDGQDWVACVVRFHVRRHGCVIIEAKGIVRVYTPKPTHSAGLQGRQKGRFPCLEYRVGDSPPGCGNAEVNRGEVGFPRREKLVDMPGEHEDNALDELDEGGHAVFHL